MLEVIAEDRRRSRDPAVTCEPRRRPGRESESGVAMVRAEGGGARRGDGDGDGALMVLLRDAGSAGHGGEDRGGLDPVWQW